MAPPPLDMTVTADTIIALVGVFFGALASVVVGTVTVMRKLSELRAGVKTVQAEVSPNHGSSIKDALQRIEVTLAHHSEMVKSLGHQLGELHASADTTHEDILARLRALETRER